MGCTVTPDKVGPDLRLSDLLESKDIMTQRNVEHAFTATEQRLYHGDRPMT